MLEKPARVLARCRRAGLRRVIDFREQLIDPRVQELGMLHSVRILPTELGTRGGEFLQRLGPVALSELRLAHVEMPSDGTGVGGHQLTSVFLNRLIVAGEQSEARALPVESQLLLGRELFGPRQHGQLHRIGANPPLPRPGRTETDDDGIRPRSKE